MTNALEQRISFLKRLRENARANNLDSVYQYLHGVIAGIEIATEEWEKTKASETETLPEGLLKHWGYDPALREKFQKAIERENKK